MQIYTKTKQEKSFTSKKHSLGRYSARHFPVYSYMVDSSSSAGWQLIIVLLMIL